ncbi:glycosyltransferase family 2 protein [Geobacter sp. DSM 9736]|uniref:glycosyltransferase family 2 protein n=1 Tax=Geobacter sp. DSM 9736 TaxID=1277350 RepID=UPI000B50E544|nr:glycosyltransferase family 2 protein [Geobacter sp. DSM 9736]SNB45025.1 Glycosyltransferase involved in cell wall bisynthesis [Geobacter sp. DSM 9736]
MSREKLPLVSILVPVYNREALVQVCIESALVQTVSNIEVVVVDNASTDGTFEVCTELAARDPRVRVFRNASNIGPVRNWIRCIEEARGAYGKVLFSDDLMAPDYLEKTLPFMEINEVGFVFTPAFVGPEPFSGNISYQFTGRTGTFPSSRFISTGLFNGDVPFSPGGALFRMNDLRKNLLREIPSPTINDFLDHGAGPDFLLYLLTAAQYPKVAYLHEPLSYFRAHGGSITMSSVKPYIAQCYRQARLWFAEQYLTDRWLKMLYVYEWKRETNEKGKRESVDQFVRQFTLSGLTISIPSIVYGLAFSKLFKKGVLTLPGGKGRIKVASI